jgi:hypothetical protein
LFPIEASGEDYVKRRDFITLLGGAAVAWPLAACAHQDNRVRALLNRILRMQAENVAAVIGQFIEEIKSQVGWTINQPVTTEQRGFDALQLFRQVPAIVEFAWLDSSGKEQLRVSRLAMDVVASGTDYSQDPKFTEAVAHKVYYGVHFRERGPINSRVYEPWMTLSLSGVRRDWGVSVVEVPLSYSLLVRTKLGEHDATYILDAQGRLIAHPDGSLVVAGNTDMTRLTHVQAARAAGSSAATVPGQITQDIHGRDVLAAYAAVVPLGWLVFVELPVEEANTLAQ